MHRVADTFNAWREVEKYSRIVSSEEIVKNDFNISPSRYIHIAEADQHRPITEIVEELEMLDTEAKKSEQAFKTLIDQILARI